MFNILLFIFFSAMIWGGTKQKQLFCWKNTIIMSVFGLYSVAINVFILVSKSDLLVVGINIDLKFMAIIKFFNDLWVFGSFFYVGFIKNRKFFAKKEEYDADLDILDLHDVRYTT